MPFGDLLNCFKKNLGDVAEEYGGEAARDLVEDGIEQINANQMKLVPMVPMVQEVLMWIHFYNLSLESNKED